MNAWCRLKADPPWFKTSRENEVNFRDIGNGHFDGEIYHNIAVKYITSSVFSCGCLYVAVNHSEGGCRQKKKTRIENKKETN